MDIYSAFRGSRSIYRAVCRAATGVGGGVWWLWPLLGHLRGSSRVGRVISRVAVTVRGRVGSLFRGRAALVGQYRAYVEQQ